MTDMQSALSAPTSTTIEIDQAMMNNLQIHANLQQEIIIVTTDRLLLHIREYRNALLSKMDWLTPLSITIALIPTVFIVSDFRPLFGIKSDQWQAIFGILFVCAVSWSIVAFWKSLKSKPQTDEMALISHLKQGENS